MSQEDAEVVRRIYELGQEAGSEFFDLIHPDGVFENVAEFPITGPYIGHEGVRRWREDIVEVVEDAEFILEELRDLGAGLVLTVQRLRGHARHTGIEMDVAWATLWRVDGGRVRYGTGYLTKEKALEAAGLSE
jgi:ketosteroid isomerase-like protein